MEVDGMHWTESPSNKNNSIQNSTLENETFISAKTK